MDLPRVSRVFDKWAADDPFHAACTEKQTWTQEEFFAYGEEHVQKVMDGAESIRPLRRNAALDFGCGPGRLAQAFAARFARVVGVDVSKGMIDTAVRLNRYPSCSYVLNQNPHLKKFKDGEFDLVHSCKVLQHIKPELALGYIPEFIRLLSTDGMAVFQVPERPNPRAVGFLLSRLPQSLLRPLRRIDMYGLAESAVVAAVKGAGGRVVKRESCDDAGPRWIDWRYYAVRENSAK